MVSRITLLAILLISTLTGCGSIQKARFYEPEVIEPEKPRIGWGDGQATLNGNMCVWVGDASALYLPLLAGPIGLPIFPLGILSRTPDRPGHFDLNVWLVPETDAKVYTFDPTRISVKFENNEIVNPSTIQVSRFKTNWEKETVFLFTSDTVERINYSDHWGAKPYLDFSKPIELWDWSRFIIRFEKPNREISPSQIDIRGIFYNELEQEVISFKFQEKTKLRYVISGRTANNESIGDSPSIPCRQIFDNKKNDS